MLSKAKEMKARTTPLKGGGVRACRAELGEETNTNQRGKPRLTLAAGLCSAAAGRGRAKPWATLPDLICKRLEIGVLM